LRLIKRYQGFFYLIFFCGMIIFLSACSKCGLGKADSDQIVAYVNKEPIFASDLKRSMALKARQDPLMTTTPDAEQEQLDMMVERKLIIQESLRMGLASQDSFVQTIKTFWEQNLIREFLNFKKKEFQNYLYATDTEIRKYYDNLGKRVTFKVLKSRDKQRIDAIYNEIKQNKAAETDDWDIIGPVGYGDITSNVLYEAFQLVEGQFKVIEEAPYYYLVTVIQKQDITLKSLE